MRMTLAAASLLALGLATSMSYAQSNPAPAGATMDKSHSSDSGTPTHRMKKKVDPMATHSTTKNFNKQNCKSLSGKNSLQTQGGNSNTENTENTCADNNN